MQLHYVDDRILDSRIMAGLFRGAENVNVELSNSLEQFQAAGRIYRPDCVLLDVVRPDAISLEQDVAAVREVSSAPVVFVTGGDIGDLRRESLVSGADGVIEKSDLTRELVAQSVANAIERARVRQPRSGQIELAVDNESPRILQRQINDSTAAIAASYLGRELETLDSQLSRNVIPFRLREQIRQLSIAATGLDACHQSDSNVIEKANLKDVAAIAARELSATLEAMSICALWDVDDDQYLLVGSFVQAVEGIRQLVLGAAALLKDGGTLLISSAGASQGRGVTLKIYSAGLFLPTDWHRQGAVNACADVPDLARSSLALATSLLGIQRDKLKVLQTGQTAALCVQL